jgi:ADP-ribose pyrophosphatase
MALPRLPRHRVRIVEEAPSSPGERGFIYVRQLSLELQFEDGSTSSSFPYFCAERTRLDAVVVVAHYLRNGERFVVLRSSIRPPLVVRAQDSWPIPPTPSLGALWEVPAGLVEQDERSAEGLARCAARELLEETGFEVPVGDIKPLGPPTFPSAGMMSECHYFFHVEVDPDKRGTPPEDGSPLEQLATIVDLPLHEALVAVRRGEVQDAKTELALRRFAEIECQ